ncbi:hypothetical protein HA402_013777 [Bradysia odoriphaga]|nr:hypothetical protein HA402_013777 [Bradysia odoriphaga]
MKLFVLTLLVAGSIATHGDGRDQRHRRSTDSDESTLSLSTSPSATTTATSIQGPLVGCESCLNSKLTVGDTFAGHCFPDPSKGECHCLCADIFCRNGETIDRTTCVNGGSISDCKCTDLTVANKPLTSEEKKLLEYAYGQCKYIAKNRQKMQTMIKQQTNLTETIIKRWFEKRREKERRDARKEAYVAQELKTCANGETIEKNLENIFTEKRETHRSSYS